VLAGSDQWLKVRLLRQDIWSGRLKLDHLDGFDEDFRLGSGSPVAKSYPANVAYTVRLAAVVRRTLEEWHLHDPNLAADRVRYWTAVRQTSRMGPLLMCVLALAACYRSATREAPPANSGGAPEPSKTTPQETACERYLRTSERYLACNSVPAGARLDDQRYRTELESRLNARLDTEARQALVDDCEAAAQAVFENAHALGCPL